MVQRISISILIFTLLCLSACKKTESYETTMEVFHQIPGTPINLETPSNSLTKNLPCIPDSIPYFVSIQQIPEINDISLLVNFNANKGYTGTCDNITAISQIVVESYGTFYAETTYSEINNMDLSIPVTLTDWSSDVSFTVEYSDCSSWACDLCLEMEIADTFTESNSIILTCGNEILCDQSKSGTLSLILPGQLGGGGGQNNSNTGD